MKERQRVLSTGLTLLMMIVWLGFLFHRSARFAGSLWGGVLGVSGALLMLVPLAYLLVKRIKRLKQWATKRTSMRTLLAWHVYAGIIGPILVILHTGHKFESTLGILLTAMTLVVVVSGFVGLYVMKQFSTAIRQKKATLAGLQDSYAQAAVQLSLAPAQHSGPGLVRRIVESFLAHESPAFDGPGTTTKPAGLASIVRLSGSIADVEYAIKMHESFKRWFGKWLKFHIVISCALYFLMALHVWAAVHFGLRWFPRTEALDLDRPVAKDFHSVGDSAAPVEATSPIESATAKLEFDRFLGAIFQKHWRPQVLIHGIPTIVFDFAALAKEASQPQSDFARALSALRRVNPMHLGGGPDEMAFWINVYNLGAMKLVADNYPVTSITDPKISAGNPWGIEGIQVGNSRFALSQIETERLLDKFGDPRIVFAVSCAAVSCPDRSNSIFSGDRIDEQLDEVTRELFSNSQKGFAIDRQNEVVRMSWILKADRRLFGDGSDGALLEFAGPYLSSEDQAWVEEARPGIKLQHFEHDWSLNDIALADGDTP